jgi:alpha-tubulin suppressor-like RCC1 family protein
VRFIAVGAFHNLALQEDGTLWAWGNNEYGQFGTRDTQPRSQPVPACPWMEILSIDPLFKVIKYMFYEDYTSPC